MSYAELKAIAEAATPGPWKALDWQVGSEFDGFAVADAMRDSPLGQDALDAAFVATFDPPMVLALITGREIEQEMLRNAVHQLAQLTDEVERLNGALARIEAERGAVRAEGATGVIAVLTELLDEEHAPWNYTEYGVLCTCGSAMDADEQCIATVPLRDALADVAPCEVSGQSPCPWHPDGGSHPVISGGA